MKRIAIVGSPGSGKSTFSRQLAQVIDLPLVHLDQEFQLPGWKERPAKEWAEIHAGLIKKDTWIIDGGYFGTGNDRFARCDMVVLFDVPTHICLYRVIKRILTNYGRVRADAPPGCPERFDWEFLVYVLKYRKNHGDLRLRVRQQLPTNSELVILRNNADIEILLNRFKTA